MRASGIYTIAHIGSGRLYVGSAVSMHYRWNKHRSDLRRGVHHSPKLQNAWNTYGEEAFVFSPLLVCEPADLVMYEQRALDGFDAARTGLNLCPTAQSVLGYKRGALSEEHKAKLRAARARRPRETRTPEQRAKMRAAQALAWSEQGRVLRKKRPPFTPETKAKISAALTGKPKSAEHRAKNGLSKKLWAQTPAGRAHLAANGRKTCVLRWGTI